METAAYWVAQATLLGFPAALTFWFIIHPFTQRWRRLGPVKTYLAVIAVLILLELLLFLFSEPLLRIHFGVSLPLAAIALFLFLTSVYLGILLLKHLTPAILFGLPQLSRTRSPGKLLTQGIYSRIRHPRYLQGGIALTSLALFTNYLVVYLILALYIPLIYLIVLLEERELLARFGQKYQEYSRRVPRFIPRLLPPRSSR